MTGAMDAAGAARERMLLIRRGETLWGIVHGTIRDVTRAEGGGTYRLRLGATGNELAADELVGVIEDLPVWPAGRVMARYWSEPAGGLTVHGETPMVVVDAARAPSFLRPDDETERRDGDDR